MFFRRKPQASELDEEISYHVERQVEQKIAAGMSASEARRQALITFGGVTQIREECREARSVVWLGTLLQDVRYAIRCLARSKGFAAIVISTLALGVGANTAVFSLLDALSYRPLPVDRPQELVYLRDPSFSYPIFRAVENGATSFAGVFGWSNESMLVSAGGEPYKVNGLIVTGSFYGTLGVNATIGRTLGPADVEQPVAVVSYDFWRRNLASDPAVVGRKLRVERLTFTIIGVTPPSFFGVAPGTRADITIPVRQWPKARPSTGDVLESTTSSLLHIMARLRPGVTLRQADSELQVLWPRVMEQNTPPNLPAGRRAHYLGRKTGIEPAASGWSSIRRAVVRPLTWLMGIVAIVLLIACGNLANLMLARGMARRREMSIRSALGATRPRIVRQLLTESALLAVSGAALSLAVAWFLAGALKVFLSSSDWQVEVPFHPDARVLAATAGFTLLTLLLFAVFPAFRASRADVHSGMKAARAFRIATVLVVAQVALTLVLVTGAGLFVWSLRNLESVDTGFRTQGILIVKADALAAGYEGERLANFFVDLRHRLLAVPGVESAALSWAPPVSNEMGTWTQRVQIRGQAHELETPVYFNTISSGFFQTLDIPLLAGRDFDARDHSAAPRVAVVNDAFARAWFNGGNPVGQHIGIGRSQARQDLEIVGVSGNATYQRLDEPVRPTVYLPWGQAPETNLTASVRVAGPLTSVTKAVRDQIDAGMHVEMEALDGRIAASLVRERAMGTLSTCFAVLALLLACLGLYGVLAITVSRRTQEIGVRIALGAMPAKVLLGVMWDALRLMAWGIAAGIPLCLWASAGVRSLLFQVEGARAIQIGLAAAILLAAGAVAAWVPARRAAGVDPTTALRQT